MRDTLFVFQPGFHEKDNPYFCPYSAQIVGFLSYYPHVRASLDVVELGWDKPREPLASMLGEDHQSAPVSALANRVDVPITARSASCSTCSAPSRPGWS